MSCSRPFEIKTKKFSFITNSYYHYVPCGYCLNCRVDKANALTHRCEQELINFKCGAFVTLTYDDYHIVDNLVINKNGLEATLNKNDLKRYLWRLKKNIKNKMPDNLLSAHNFKYLAVGEYGGDGQIFDRPHIHLLLFGLDFALCKKIIAKSWQGRGIVKVLPILNGGIHYVLKYLDKQLFGNLAKTKYDDNGLQRPFQIHSLGLGKNLYSDQKEYMKKHNGCYRWKGHDVPAPPYYKNKILVDSNKYLNYENSKQKYFTYEGHMPKDRYDLHDFNIRQNLLREKNINQSNFLHGRPMFKFENIYKLAQYSTEYIQKLSAQAINAAYEVPF